MRERLRACAKEQRCWLREGHEGPHEHISDGKRVVIEGAPSEPQTEAGKRAVFDGLTGCDRETILAIEAEAIAIGAKQERGRIAKRLGGDGWVRLATGATATVVHVIADDCECGALGCALEPEA